MNIPKCPGCERPIKYIEMFLTRKQSVYTCSVCKKTFNILVSDVFKIVGLGICLFGFLTSFFCILFLKNASILPFAINFLVFVLFLLVSPFFIELKEK